MPTMAFTALGGGGSSESLAASESPDTDAAEYPPSLIPPQSSLGRPALGRQLLPRSRHARVALSPRGPDRPHADHPHPPRGVLRMSDGFPRHWARTWGRCHGNQSVTSAYLAPVTRPRTSRSD